MSTPSLRDLIETAAAAVAPRGCRPTILHLAGVSGIHQQALYVARNGKRLLTLRKILTLVRLAGLDDSEAVRIRMSAEEERKKEKK